MISLRQIFHFLECPRLRDVLLTKKYSGEIFMRIIKNFIVTTLLIFICTSAYGMAKPEHSKIWNEAFGITDKNSREKIQPLWNTAQDVIDGFKPDYKDKLQKNFDWFKWGDYGHRLLFHWGFNADPKRHDPLVRQVRLRLKDRQDAQEQEREFFRYLTREIQSERNRNLINSVIKTTGIPTARGYANAIATIVYDIHLLGDYSTTNTSALPSIGDIEKDLIDYGFKRLLTGGEKSEKLKRIEMEFDAAVKIGRGRTNRKRAENLREAVRIFLPQILNERFKNTLSEKGITITESK